MSDRPANRSAILVVDDEQEHAQVMCEALQRQGHACDVVYNLSDAVARMDKKKYDVIVTDLMMDGKPDGMEVVRHARELTPPPPVIMVTAHGDIPTYKKAMFEEGAYDFIEKPLDLDLLRTQVNRAAEKSMLQKQNLALAEQIADTSGFEGIVGKSEGMRKVIATARQIASSDIPVLIMGESGTGKELFARAIHNNSRRRKAKLVALNCAGLAESILEDELFGHVRGSFTGANTDREGRFEHADGGTLFMDEIGDMPNSMQAKLLRVLENGEVVRLGSNDPIQVDVRLISATNRNLDEMVAEKEFREDLYFRIKGMTILIPPLRERREDIPLLIHFFMKQAAEKYGKKQPNLKPQTLAALMAYSWPGNVRQLRNAVENMLVLSNGADEIDETALPPEMRPAGPAATTATPGMTNLVGISIEQAERELIRNTLAMTKGNREQAAKMLQIGERTLYRKIREYGL
jgi:two-component system response regulator HydG